MKLTEDGWSISTGIDKKKMKATKINFICPKCGISESFKVAVKRGHVFDPDEWYAAKEPEKTAKCIAPEGTVKCDDCDKEFFFRMELIPSVTTYKLVPFNPTIMTKEDDHETHE